MSKQKPPYEGGLLPVLPCGDQFVNQIDHLSKRKKQCKKLAESAQVYPPGLFFVGFFKNSHRAKIGVIPSPERLSIKGFESSIFSKFIFLNMLNP